MTTTSAIRLRPAVLTPAAFAPFGEVIGTEGRPHRTINDGYAERYHDLSRIDAMEAGGKPLLNIFAAKQTELRDRIANLKLQLDVVDRSHDEMSDLAVKVFELSQALSHKWLTADYATKRRIMEIVFLNCRLDDATLCPEIRKPFDVIAEGLLVQSSRGDRI